jgi:hypothetical protein
MCKAFILKFLLDGYYFLTAKDMAEFCKGIMDCTLIGGTIRSGQTLVTLVFRYLRHSIFFWAALLMCVVEEIQNICLLVQEWHL